MCIKLTEFSVCTAETTHDVRERDPPPQKKKYGSEWRIRIKPCWRRTERGALGPFKPSWDRDNPRNPHRTGDVSPTLRRPQTSPQGSALARYDAVVKSHGLARGPVRPGGGVRLLPLLLPLLFQHIHTHSRLHRVSNGCVCVLRF